MCLYIASMYVWCLIIITILSWRTLPKDFESLFERLVDYTVIDDIKAIPFYNTFSRKDNYRDKF